jgi:hypothetical protein
MIQVEPLQVDFDEKPDLGVVRLDDVIQDFELGQDLAGHF